jgi:dTDP-glucose pyrophosphorylase
MTLVIMAAGMGSRYGGLKQIDPVTPHGEFIVDFSIFDAKRAGVDKVVFIIKRENYDIFRDTVGKRIEGGVEVSYVFQDMDAIPEGATIPEGRVKPWGTGHAVLCCKDVVKENFIVINADDFYGADAYAKLAEFLKDAKADTKAHFAMVGYVLENTITENGTVARGICETENGLLTAVTERTKIKENDGVVQFMEGDTWYDVARDATVSMNFWGFTPEIFDMLERDFKLFHEDIKAGKEDSMKGEFFLPYVVAKAIKTGECDARVLKTDAKWYGVTYHDDKPVLEAYIKKAVSDGDYPDGLWK